MYNFTLFSKKKYTFSPLDSILSNIPARKCIVYDQTVDVVIRFSFVCFNILRIIFERLFQVIQVLDSGAIFVIYWSCWLASGFSCSPAYSKERQIIMETAMIHVQWVCIYCPLQTFSRHLRIRTVFSPNLFILQFYDQLCMDLCRYSVLIEYLKQLFFYSLSSKLAWPFSAIER